MKKRRNANQEQTVIFLHIPKAAGSTMYPLLEHNYEPEAILTVEGSLIEQCIAEFKKLPEANKREIKFIRGHMPFGLHRVVPGPSTYVTLLREPVDRIISRYYYTLRRPDNYLYDILSSENTSLKDFVCSGISTETNNDQTRRLSGVGRTIPFGKCPDEILEIAKRNLQDYFTVVGLAEKFDETLLLINKMLGWKVCLYVKSNVTKNRPRKEDISKDTLDVIERYNKLDMELYRYAEKLFGDLLSRQGPSFQRQLKVFKLLNEPYGRVYTFARSTKHGIMVIAGD